MNYEILFSIVGIFGTLALSINAFFLRGIYQDLNAVKIAMAQISTRGEAKEKRLDTNDENIKEIYARINSLEREVLK